MVWLLGGLCEFVQICQAPNTVFHLGRPLVPPTGRLIFKGLQGGSIMRHQFELLEVYGY